MTESTTSRFEQDVIPRLRALGRRLKIYLLLDGLAIVCLALAAATLITLAIDYSFWLAWDMRLVQLTTLLAAIGVLAWKVMLAPLRVTAGDASLAALVERRYPQLRSRLVSAVEFASIPAADWAFERRRSRVLAEEVVHQAEAEAASLAFDDVLSHARARQRSAIVAACVIGVGIICLSARETMGLWFQRNVMLRDVDWPQRNRLTVEGLVDGRMVVPRGDDVTISAVVDEGYSPPRQVYLEYEGPTGLSGRDQMPAITGDRVRFTHTFERVDATLRCRVRGGDFRGEPFLIDVVDRPRLSHVVIGVTPPAYTKLDPYDLRAGQTVGEALEGSAIQLRVETNKPVTHATLVRTLGGEKTELGEAERLSDQRFTATDRPTGSATYHFELVDDLGLTNRSERAGPVPITIRLLPDEAPKVKLRIRGAGEMITPEAILPLETDYSDTYGLASAELVHELGREGAPPVAEPASGLEPGTKTFAEKTNWVVGQRGVSEGDRLTLYARAADFDDVPAPNVGESPKMVFRVVSREDLLAELNRREQEYRQDFERMLRQQEELYASILTLSTPAGPSRTDPDRPEQFKRLARRQRDHAGRLNTLRLQFDQVLAELRINQLASPATESRLGGAVIEPLEALSRSLMPDAANAIDDVAAQDTPETLGAARGLQDQVLAEMNRILENMLKWEGFQEAVVLLREVMKMQKNVSQEVEKQIEDRIFGTSPASGPSNNQ